VTTRDAQPKLVLSGVRLLETAVPSFQVGLVRTYTLSFGSAERSVVVPVEFLVPLLGVTVAFNSTSSAS
jgi:hypothetical protein